MNYLVNPGIYILMKGIKNIIYTGVMAFMLASCGTEVAREQIHELPRFNASYYSKALEALNEKIERAPQNADGYFKKGEVLEKLNNPDNAIINYKKAIKLDSLNPGYYKSLARLFFRNDKLSRAEENALKAQQLGDQTADLYQLLADVYIKKGEFTIALNHLNRAIDTAPRNSAYTFRKGKLYLELGDTLKAKDYLLGNLHRIDPGPEVYESLADIYLAEKDYNKAVAYLDSSIEHTSRNKKELLVKKAGFLQRSGNLSAAKSLLNQQLKEDSANFALNYKLAELHMNSYAYDSALYYLGNSVLLDSKSKEAFLLMGRVYDKKRMYLTAQDQYKNALLIDTSYQQARVALQDLEKKMAYIQRQKTQQVEQQRQRELPQLESIKPITRN